MWLTFVGDVACPVGALPTFEGLEVKHFQTTIVNFEGALAHNPQKYCRSRWPGTRKLYNGPCVERMLSRLNVRVASLANNHITDCSVPVSVTRARLKRLGIASCGAGKDIKEAKEPAVVQSSGQKLVFLPFGWDNIECVPARKYRQGVNPLEPDHVLDCVDEMKERHPDATLVLLMHWNYELEPFPQPLHRRLAFQAIEKGVAGIIGHHPHVAGGAEKYCGAPIIYTLGNWYLPQGRKFGFMIDWPERVRYQLAFEWNVKSGESRFHWYYYKAKDDIICDRGVEQWDGERISALSPFRGMSHGQYKEWFRKNRLQRSALPIYVDSRHRVRNRIKDIWIRIRSYLINLRSFLLDILSRRGV